MDQKNDPSVIRLLQIESTFLPWCVMTWRLLNLDARREESLKHVPPSEFSEEKQRINSSK